MKLPPSRSVAFLLLALACAAPAWARMDGVRGDPASAPAVSRSVASAAPSLDAASTAVWREGGRARRAWMAVDELATVPDEATPRASRASPDPRGRFARSGRAGPGLDFWRSYVARPSASEIRDLVDESAAGGRSRSLPVFYESPEAAPGSRLVLTGEVVVRYAKDATPEAIENVEWKNGLTRLRRLPGEEPAFLYAASGPFAALDAAERLAAEPAVAESQPHWLRRRERRFIPNDPLFQYQWHLMGEEANGASLATAWDARMGSPSTVIVVVDDGLEIAHEDLQPNIVPGLSASVSAVGGQITGDPSPGPDDDHGTACAGVAAARGGNGLGVSGAAPMAGLAGVRIPLDAVSDAIEATALSWRTDVFAVSSESWGPQDDGERLEGPGPLAQAAIEGAVASGRGGRGTVFVWAGGNGALDGDNSNYDGYANSRYTLAVGATTDDGVKAPYSEPGANLMVCAPSSGGVAAVTTVDRTGALGYNAGSAPLVDYVNANYTRRFGGTSSAAPLVAGVVGLMIDANPLLGWRDAQRILMTTAFRTDPQDADWKQNGAGYWVNHKYGFGRVDAARAVAAAASWKQLPPETVVDSAERAPNLAIPDDNPTGVTDSVTVDANLAVEYVDVYFSSDHPYWGDLRITLVSPAGTESVLAEPHVSGPSVLTSPTGHYDNWRFGSARLLGESSQGVWTLRVSDEGTGDAGVLQGWKLRIHGAPPRALVPFLPLLLPRQRLQAQP